VNVSRYGFGAKSAYPASPSLDMSGRCPHISIDIPTEEGDSIGSLASELARLEDLENELSLAQRYVHGRLTDVLDRLNERIGADSDSRFYAEILAAVATGSRTPEAIADEVDTAPENVERSLAALAERGLVEEHRGDWYVAE
jgi:ArsR family transcriptional regulator